MKIIKDITYTKLGHPEQKLDVYLPDTDTFPVFVYFHGGGIEAGKKSECTECSFYSFHSVVSYFTCYLLLFFLVIIHHVLNVL